MNVLTKNTILSIIAEQMLSVDEMSARPAELWQTEKLEQPMVIDLPGVTSLNPDTQTPEEGKVISNIIRISPKGQRLLQFKNLAKGGQRMWLEIGTDKVHPHLPRNDVYGTKWSGPKPLEDLYRDDEDKDKKIATRKENLTNEWPKRNLIFPIINSLFRSPNIIRQLDRCGIPEIVADNEYTEPVTNVRKIMLWTGPKLYFNFHAIRDEEDVQTALDKILDYRMSLEDGGEVNQQQDRQKPVKMVRAYGGQVYPGGKWTPEQIAYAEKYHKLTPVYKLHKKAVQGGHKAFNLRSDIDFIGGIIDNEYSLGVSFSVTKYYRTAGASRGKDKGKIIEPIRVHKSLNIPEGINPEELTIKNHKEFFKEIFKMVLTELGEQILQIDADEVLTQLLFEPSDVDKEF